MLSTFTTSTPLPLFVVFLHCCVFADYLQPAVLRLLRLGLSRRRRRRLCRPCSPSLPPFFSPCKIASTPLPLHFISMHRPKTISQFCAPRASTGTLCGVYASFFFLSCFHCLGHFGVSVSTLRGEFGLLGLLWHVLTFLYAILTIFVSAAAFCVFLHTVDSSATFPRPPSSPMCRLFVPTGEFRGFTLPGGITDFGCSCSQCRVDPSMCTCLRVPDISASFPGP